jgi:hypothetical protein
VVGEVTVNGSSGVKYDGISTIYSGGFALSGIKNSTLWANGVMSAARVWDFRVCVTTSFKLRFLRVTPQEFFLSKLLSYLF